VPSAPEVGLSVGKIAEAVAISIGAGEGALEGTLVKYAVCWATEEGDGLLVASSKAEYEVLLASEVGYEVPLNSKVGYEVSFLSDVGNDEERSTEGDKVLGSPEEILDGTLVICGSLGAAIVG